MKGPTEQILPSIARLRFGLGHCCNLMYLGLLNKNPGTQDGRRRQIKWSLPMTGLSPRTSVYEETTLPTEPNQCPKSDIFCSLFWIWILTLTCVLTYMAGQDRFMTFWRQNLKRKQSVRRRRNFFLQKLWNKILLFFEKSFAASVINIFPQKWLYLK